MKEKGVVLMIIEVGQPDLRVGSVELNSFARGFKRERREGFGGEEG